MCVRACGSHVCAARTCVRAARVPVHANVDPALCLQVAALQRVLRGGASSRNQTVSVNTETCRGPISCRRRSLFYCLYDVIS